jgi:hypothetical protein
VLLSQERTHLCRRFQYLVQQYKWIKASQMLLPPDYFRQDDNRDSNHRREADAMEGDHFPTTWS